MGSSGEWVESEIVHAIHQVMEGHHTNPTSFFYRPRRRWVRSKDTLNKAIMARIVLAGAVMADENCLLRVVGDSSILSVSPHRDRLWTGSGSIGPFEPSAAHATLPDDAPPSAGCQTPAAPLDAPCSCPIHGSAPWHNQSGASHTGMDAPPWPSPMP